MSSEQLPLLAEDQLPHDIYAEVHSGQLDYIGSVKLPPAIPTELEVEYLGWTYVYKLDRRYKEGGTHE